jgi:integrase
MASLRKRPKSPFYVACYYGADGRRTQRSTETTDRRVAMRQALEWEKAARETQSKTFTVDKARRVLNEMLALTGQGIDNQSTREFCQAWMKTKTATRAASTAVTYGPVIDSFLATLGRKADAPLSAILPKDIEAHRDALTLAGKRATTIRQYVKIIGAMFEAARRQGMIQSNPMRSVEMDDAEQESREPFTMEEFRALLSQAEGDWKTAILLGGFTAMRIGDATSITWESIDLAEGVIKFIPQKLRRKGREVVLPIHPILQKHLMSIAGDDPRAPLCPALAGRSSGGKTGLSRQFIAIMKAAGIDNQARTTARKDKDNKARTQSAKSFHSLRHFFNTQLLASGVDEKIRMALSGHTTAGINRRYSHAKLETLREAMKKLEGVE